MITGHLHFVLMNYLDCSFIRCMLNSTVYTQQHNNLHVIEITIKLYFAHIAFLLNSTLQF